MPEQEAPKEAPGLFDEPLKGAFVTDRLETDLRQQIESGVLKPGTLIKPVRSLMKQYGISYNSVRRALNQLADGGYLALEQGRGTFVKGAKVPRADGSQIIVNKYDKAVAEKHEEIEVKRSKPTGPATGRARAGSPVKTAGVADDEVRKETSESVKITGATQPVQVLVSAPRDQGIAVLAPAEMLKGGQDGLAAALQSFCAEALASGLRLTLVPVMDAPDQGRGHDAGARAYAIWGRSGSPAPDGVVRGECPAVWVGYLPPNLNVSAVMPENFAGAHALTRGLLAKGHHAFAFVYGSGAPASAGLSKGTDEAERLDGCRVALEESEEALPDSHVIQVPDAAEWLADRILALKPRPTAVFASEQALAEALIRQLRERGVGVPRVFSVVCFGGKDVPNALDITSVRVDWHRAGLCALNRLRELWSGVPSERLRISLPVEFHEGSTVGEA